MVNVTARARNTPNAENRWVSAKTPTTQRECHGPTRLLLSHIVPTGQLTYVSWTRTRRRGSRSQRVMYLHLTHTPSQTAPCWQLSIQRASLPSSPPPTAIHKTYRVRHGAPKITHAACEAPCSVAHEMMQSPPPFGEERTVAASTAAGAGAGGGGAGARAGSGYLYCTCALGGNPRSARLGAGRLGAACRPYRPPSISEPL